VDALNDELWERMGLLDDELGRNGEGGRETYGFDGIIVGLGGTKCEDGHRDDGGTAAGSMLLADPLKTLDAGRRC
jgi:hypothetical protein